MIGPATNSGQNGQTLQPAGFAPWKKARGIIFLFPFLTGIFLAQQQLSIEVKERAGATRNGEYVCFGVPLPRGWNVTDVSRLRLGGARGTPIPAQLEVLARWGSHPADAAAPIKWVLVGYLESVSAASAKTVILDTGGPGPASPVVIGVDTATPGTITVDTGAARFAVNNGADFNLINQVWINSQPLLQPLGVREAIHYEPVGGVVGIVPGGTPDLTPRTTSVRVERPGLLHTILKAEGSILDAASQPVLDFTARLHFTAGRADVQVDFTVENNHPVIADDTGQPRNVHDQGSINSVYIGELSLNLRLGVTSGSSLRVLTEQAVDVTSPVSPVCLYQDSAGTSHWNSYVGPVGWPGSERLAIPRLQAFCTQPGYEITGAGAALTGAQALGWMTALRPGETGPRVSVAVKDFWQNFPKAIQVASDGTVSVDLFPKGDQFHHNFRPGEEKTHRLLFHFGLGTTDATESIRLATAFQNPLFGAAPASAYIQSGALGEVSAADLIRWPLYERYVRVAFEPNPDFDPNIHNPSFGNSTLREAIERYNFFGWQDYGDFPIDFEAFGPNQAGQMNLKYWFQYALLLQFCRSADLIWLDLAMPAAWHLADIDYLHIPDGGIQHWSQGAYFGHSNHDEPGCTNPNRNSNSPSVDLFFGVPDLLLAYYLTGESRFRDTALEGLAAMENLSQFSDFTQSVFQRERANLVFAYIEGYRLTGDERWLTALRGVVGPTADLGNKPWLNDPAAYGRTHTGEFVSMFMFSQVAWSLGRYLDFCHEYNRSDDLGVARALAAYADFTINYTTTEYQSGQSAFPHEYYFDRSDPSYPDINNWALVMADVLAYAYKYSGTRRYLDTAAKYYTTGTIDQVWLDDPPVYLSTKDLVNSCNWGLVYMNQTSPGAFRMGDLNSDGVVDAMDLVILRLYLAGVITQGSTSFSAPLAAARLNGDGVIDDIDLSILAGWLAGEPVHD